jgi:phage-related tail fiber protein
VSSDKFFALFGKTVLVLVFLAAVSVVAFYFGTKSQQKQTSQPQSYNQPSTSLSKTTPAEILTPTIDETSALKVVIKNALVAEHRSDANALNITVSKIEGDYASGDASAQSGRGIWFATKVNGAWKLVWDGNGSIQCSSLIAYPNFPIDMIPECWNDKTQSVVKR